MRRLIYAGLALGMLVAFGTLAPQQVHAQTSVVFSEEDRARIKEYLSQRILYGREEAEQSADSKSRGKAKAKGRSAPKGLAKRDRLPPGLEKQLEKNGSLPPGLESRPLPEELERFLGNPPKGTERVIVGADVVLIEKRTQRILDIVRDVILSGG